LSHDTRHFNILHSCFSNLPHDTEQFKSTLKHFLYSDSFYPNILM
jgi:hypothetical protein